MLAELPAWEDLMSGLEGPDQNRREARLNGRAQLQTPIAVACSSSVVVD